ncbi:MAG: glucose-1-phosphate adenylyltransferase [Betaproteobacteria bacterium]|nr:glucose-1-phosphate adenylyltransferase [Betaproteobacteria bacterium]
MTRADLNDPLFPLEVLARRSPDPLSRSTMALILAGGRGSRLGELTDWRAKPSIPFGGKFRIIDFALSNCVNSGIRRIGICTQYKAQSLIRHVQRGWSFFDGRFAEFVELLPAQQRVEVSWYRGTADAVYQNLDILRLHAPDFVLVLAGDHVYKMDYGRMLEEHVACEAQLTIACIDVPLADARALGVVQIDDDGRIVRFDEKPAAPAPIPGNPGRALASMGIYVFDAGFLYAELLRDADDAASGHDFGRDLIPRLIAEGARVRAHDFARSCVNMYHDVPYWRDVGTVDAFYEANLALVKVEPELNLYDEAWPIWTHQEQLPPAKFVFDDDGRRGTALDSIVGSGCIVSGSTVRRSLLFSKVRVHSYCTIEDSVILPNVEIGRHVRLRRTIVDKHCRLPAGLVVGIDPAADRRRFHVTDGGVTLIIPEMLGQRIHHLR